VPEGCAEIYEADSKWSRFKHIIADVPPTLTKCAVPTISMNNGVVSFDCETKGVSFFSTIQYSTGSDFKGTGNNFTVSPTTMTVSVYATKSGYANSPTVTKTYNLNDPTKAIADVNQDGKVNSTDVVAIYNYIIHGAQ